MKNGKVCAGVIGVGIGKLHVAGYAAHKNCECVAICDLDLPKAQAVADQHGAKYVFKDYKKFLAMDELDIVSVALPNHLHAPVTIAALQAGKHVLCEKPMSSSLADAEEMVRVAKRAGKNLMIDMTCRFMPGQLDLRNRIANGEFGEVYYAKTSYLRRNGIPFGANNWFIQSRYAGGGASMDIGVHVYDLVWWLMGSPKPTTVLASSYSRMLKDRAAAKGIKGDVDDLTSCLVKFNTGQTIAFDASWDGHNPEYTGYHIYGTKGAVECTSWGTPILHSETKQGKPVDKELKIKKGTYCAFSHFVDVCRDGETELIASGEECLNVMRVLDAIRRSHKTGKAVNL